MPWNPPFSSAATYRNTIEVIHSKSFISHTGVSYLPPSLKFISARWVFFLLWDTGKGWRTGHKWHFTACISRFTTANIRHVIHSNVFYGRQEFHRRKALWYPIGPNYGICILTSGSLSYTLSELFMWLFPCIPLHEYSMCINVVYSDKMIAFDKQRMYLDWNLHIQFRYGRIIKHWIPHTKG